MSLFSPGIYPTLTFFLLNSEFLSAVRSRKTYLRLLVGDIGLRCSQLIPYQPSSRKRSTWFWTTMWNSDLLMSIDTSSLPSVLNTSFHTCFNFFWTVVPFSSRYLSGESGNTQLKSPHHLHASECVKLIQDIVPSTWYHLSCIAQTGSGHDTSKMRARVEDRLSDPSFSRPHAWEK